MTTKKDKQKTSYFLKKITKSLLVSYESNIDTIQFLYFINLLQNLKCPFIEDFSESWVGELLLSPNEVRFRILRWLFETLDPSLSLLLDSEKNFGNSSNDKIRSKYQNVYDIDVNLQILICYNFF